ncbi:MAG: holo-[acyl-carrier-protein] synthase [bacterium]|nr:holo-[acyl-carrier-protein] synthase [bacterium]
MNKTIAGIGVDIEQIKRFSEKPFKDNENFYKKLFSDNEIEYCLRMKNPYPNFTARFCAKEALWKALSNIISITWHDIEIRNDDNGKPVFCILTTDKKKAAILSKFKIFVSLSHDKENAVAYVIVQENE